MNLYKITYDTELPYENTKRANPTLEMIEFIFAENAVKAIIGFSENYKDPSIENIWCASICAVESIINAEECFKNYPKKLDETKIKIITKEALTAGYYWNDDPRLGYRVTLENIYSQGVHNTISLIRKEVKK